MVKDGVGKSNKRDILMGGHFRVMEKLGAREAPRKLKDDPNLDS